ncbi:hypothetical protein ACB092_05G017700 [Castanea dentata]
MLAFDFQFLAVCKNWVTVLPKLPHPFSLAIPKVCYHHGNWRYSFRLTYNFCHNCSDLVNTWIGKVAAHKVDELDLKTHHDMGLETFEAATQL